MSDFYYISIIVLLITDSVISDVFMNPKNYGDLTG